MPRKTAGYGWRPDLPDHRDHLFAAAPQILATLPPVVDLRAQCPPVYDQGQLGSCTANAIGGALHFDQMKQKSADVFVPSRLFIYYNERAMEGSINYDAGASIRDGVYSVSKQGAPHESMWPYIISKFASKPTTAVYQDALKHTAISYMRVTRSIAQMEGCVAAGYPFIIGFSVYDSFESNQVASSGVLNMPTFNEQLLGGHAVMVVGYDNNAQRFIMRNSWGVRWGQKGYFTMPFAYLMDPNLSSDFWTIRQVTQ